MTKGNYVVTIKEIKRAIEVNNLLFKEYGREKFEEICSEIAYECFMCDNLDYVCKCRNIANNIGVTYRDLEDWFWQTMEDWFYDDFRNELLDCIEED